MLLMGATGSIGALWKFVRSLMNVPFTLEKSELEAEFIKEVAKENMVQPKVHR